MLTPANIPWRVVGAGLLALGVFAAGWVTNGWRLGQQIEAMQAERTSAALSAAVDQVKAVDRARAEEQRRTAAQTEIANVAKQDADTARADARAAGDAADRLRQRVDQLLAAARAAKDPGTAGGSQSQPSGDPLDVLVDVLGRSDRAAGILAAYADQLKVAGLACERSYDALIRTEER